MNRTKPHEELVRRILAEIGARKDLRVWKANTGAVKTDGRFIRFGLPGMADITGILAGGRRLEIEVKTGSARQTTQQKNFQEMIEHFGGIYILARSVDDVTTVLNTCQRKPDMA